MPPPPIPLISVENLSLYTSLNTTNSIPKREILKNISFEILHGQTLGIVGESGSGKSITALAILGLLPANAIQVSEGQIMFLPRNTPKNQNSQSETSERIDLLKLSDAHLRKIRGAEISMIFQEPGTSLNPLHRVGDQVAEALQLHTQLDRKAIYQRVLALFDEVQLPRKEALYKCYPHEISGGQKQRVMIAMALACEPQLLIADEPTTALDVTVQKGVIELLKELKVSRNLSILFISHDLAVVAQIADDVAVMYQGSIIEQGKVQQVFQHPSTQYTQNLIASRPPIHKILHRLPVFDADGKTLPEQICTDSQIKNRLQHLNLQPIQVAIKNLECNFAIKKNFFGKTIQAVKAVNKVSFEIHKGETLGLVGESGSGKTTIGRCLMRLIDPNAGEIHILGENITHLSQSTIRPKRKAFQMVFQDPFASLNPRQKIGNTLTEAMKAHQLYENTTTRTAKAVEWLQIVGLEAESINRYPHEFSGGQRQRICIARALCVEPQILVCDESVSALDVSTQAQILNLLKELREKFELTMLFITHDLSVVRFLCDRVIALKNGEIVEESDILSLYNAPKHPYTRELLAAAPIFPYY